MINTTGSTHPALDKITRITMLLCLVKGFVWHFLGLIPGVLKGGERSILLGCGQDREGPLG